MKRKTKPGIYCILNITLNIRYIGSSKNISNRISTHKRQLRNNCHDNHRLQDDYNKNYLFNYIILENCDIEHLIEREQYYIDLYGGIHSFQVYNEVSSDYMDRTLETRKRMSKWQKGKPKSIETCKKLSLTRKSKHIQPWNKGKKNIYSEETLNKIRSLQNKGKKNIYSEETLNKIRLSKLGKSSWNKGIPRDDATKLKISSSLKNRPKRVWIHLDNKEKLIYKTDINTYIQNNWKLGRK